MLSFTKLSLIATAACASLGFASPLVNVDAAALADVNALGLVHADAVAVAGVHLVKRFDPRCGCETEVPVTMTYTSDMGTITQATTITSAYTTTITGAPSQVTESITKATTITSAVTKTTSVGSHPSGVPSGGLPGTFHRCNETVYPLIIELYAAIEVDIEVEVIAEITAKIIAAINVAIVEVKACVGISIVEVLNISVVVFAQIVASLCIAVFTCLGAVIKVAAGSEVIIKLLVEVGVALCALIQVTVQVCGVAFITALIPLIQVILSVVVSLNLHLSLGAILGIHI